MSDDATVPPDIRRALDDVEPPDPAWSERAAGRQARLTMPPGSLGRLLELGCRLAAIRRTERPEGAPAAVVVMAADHGVAEAGVSAYPQAVTGQMVANFLRGGAAINVLARRAGAEVWVVDLGVAHPPPIEGQPARYLSRPIRAGTSSFLDGPAMSRDEAFRAFRVGLELSDRVCGGPEGARVVALGEMGIGNTTSAAALLAGLTGAVPEAVVGRGTGVDDAGLGRKLKAVRAALGRHREAGRDAWAWASRVGGFEIVGLAGLAVGAARRRSLVILDGLISTVAGLLAARLCPPVVGSMLASHLGVEPGHRLALEALGLAPWLDLGLRLGEGSGAALVLPMVAAAADLLRDMATFDDAGVSGPV